MKYQVRKPYRYGNKIYMPGETMRPKSDDVQVLQSRGIIGGAVAETASTKPPEKAVKPKAEPRHVGGGYYDVNGKRVKGKKAAEEVMKAGD